MKPKYCTACGRELQEVVRYNTTPKFDPYTGQRLPQGTVVVLACPLYEEGYSDRAWHNNHDNVQYVEEAT
jgi:hypothetical protein